MARPMPVPLMPSLATRRAAHELREHVRYSSRGIPRPSSLTLMATTSNALRHGPRFGGRPRIFHGVLEQVVKRATDRVGIGIDLAAVDRRPRT